MPWNVTVFDSNGKIKDARISSIPIRYPEFLTFIIATNQRTAERFTEMNGDIYSSDYSEGNSSGGTTFYSSFRSQREYEDWLTNTGNVGALDQQGLRDQLTVQIERWGRTTATATIRQNFNDVVTRARDDGFQYELTNIGGALTSVVNQDTIDHGTDSGAFNFMRLGEHGLGDGSIGNGNEAHNFYGRYTSSSRRTAFLGNAVLEYERNGNGRYVDIQSGSEVLPVMYDCSISQIYRWIREYWNLDSTQVQHHDNAANFMITLTLHFIWRCQDFLESNGEDRELFFPSQVISGNFVNSVDDVSAVTNPYADTPAAVNDILEWEYRAIDDDQTPNTGAWPQQADYLRVITNHTASDNGNPGSGGSRSIGDAMAYKTSDATSDYAFIWYRANNAYNTQNIQLMQVGVLYWAAYRNHLVGDTTKRDKFIEWGDLLLAGATENDVSTNNTRARNETNYTIWQGGLLRDQMTGRNDFGGNS